MSKREYPQYDPQDVKKWLIAIFGKDIIFDTQYAQRFRGHSAKETENVLGAWKIYYTGEVFLQVDLLPGVRENVAAMLITSLQSAIDASIDPEYHKKSLQERKQAARASDWPMASDVMKLTLGIDTVQLKILAERLKEPADYTGTTVRKLLAHESAWIERQKTLPNRCAAAFLGREMKEGEYSPFRYGTGAGNSSGMELAFMFNRPWPPIFPGSEDWKGTYEWIDHWSTRSRELGMNGAFRYVDFHVGTHAPIEEQKLVIYAENDQEISNKMDALLDPKILPKVQTYFNEVLSMSLINNWMEDDRHPDYRADLNAAWKGLEDTSNEEIVTERKHRRAALDDSGKHTQWREVVSKLKAENETTGAFIKVVHQQAPDGQAEIYARLRVWAGDTFPLLTKAVLGNTVNLVSAPKTKTAAPV